MPFVSRAGQKLERALATFGLDVRGRICADLGSNVGGFVNCLLQRGASRVYAVETGWGVLDWKLRNDPRVVVMERTNAIHVQLPQKVSLVTIDVGWTKQRIILPAARRIMTYDGDIVTLIKPHYEADPALLRGGVLPEDRVDEVVTDVKSQISDLEFEIVQMTPSPIRGSAGNVEILAWLKAIR